MFYFLKINAIDTNYTTTFQPVQEISPTHKYDPRSKLYFSPQGL